MLGATGPGAMEKGTPPTGQALHFGIMKHLRDMGRATYDLGGSPGPLPQRGHPNYGGWTFKHEFGGPFVTHVDYMDRVLSRVPDMLLRGVSATLKRVRQLESWRSLATAGRHKASRVATPERHADRDGQEPQE